MGFYILSTPIGYRSFVESFVVKVLHEDLGTIVSLLMFVDPHVIFVMFSLCYAQHVSYLFRIMFPSPCIL